MEINSDHPAKSSIEAYKAFLKATTPKDTLPKSSIHQRIFNISNPVWYYANRILEILSYPFARWYERIRKIRK